MREATGYAQQTAGHAITENKHHGAMLEHIKAAQDKTPPKTRRAGKQRTQYTPTGHRDTTGNSLKVSKAKQTRTASQGCDVRPGCATLSARVGRAYLVAPSRIAHTPLHHTGNSAEGRIDPRRW